MITEKVEFSSKAHLAPMIEQLKKVTSGPGEGAAVCLCLFISLWQQFEPGQTLDEVADAARQMIMSYEREFMQ